MSRVVYLRPRTRQVVQEAPRVTEPKLFGKIKTRNRNEKNAIVLVSGDTGEGKSRFAAWMIESLDPGFMQSWQNGQPHISISPLPFIEALKYDLLPPKSWWFIDEPRNVKNVDWYKDLAQAVRDVVTEYRFKIVNLAVCTVMRKKLQNDLRDLAHYWIRMTSPGNCEVRQFRTKVKWSHGEQYEIRSGYLIERIRHAPLPSRMFESLYAPLKEDNFQGLTDMWIKRLAKKGYIK